MSGPKRNPDKLNTIGVVVVGICGAVLVYVTIVALQAFYVNDTSEVQTMADYGGMDRAAKGHKADELRNITEAARNSVAPGMQETFRINIEDAMKLIVEDAKKDPAHLVPALPPSEKATIEPVFGRPKPAAPPAPAGGAAPAGGGTPQPGSAGAAQPTPAAPLVPTGVPGQPQPVAGAGALPPSSPRPQAGSDAPPKQPKAPKAEQPKAGGPPAGSAQPKTP